MLKNGESDESRAVTVVGPDLTNVSSNCLLVFVEIARETGLVVC